MAVAAPPRAGFAERASRARELAGRFSFAAEVLEFAAALYAVQERAFGLAMQERPDRSRLALFAAERVMPEVVAVASASGPRALGDGLGSLVYGASLPGLGEAWLAGAEDLGPVETFLARASLMPLLEALPGLLPPPVDAHGLQCPACGGGPQLSYFASTGEALVAGQRRLVCARCAGEWSFPRMVCAGCGEPASARLPILADHSVLPHLRADCCNSCQTYLVTVDVAKEPAAIPVVDEVAAIPLGVVAEERGYRKLNRNLFGI